MNRIVALLLLAVAACAPRTSGAPQLQVTLDVDHVTDGGGLCYLSCLAMAGRTLRPGLELEEVVRHADPGRFASHPEMTAVAARALGFRILAGTVRGSEVRVFGQEPYVRSWRRFSGGGEAWEAAEELMARGVAPIPNIELEPLAEELPRGPVRGPHTVVMTGLGRDHVRVNDPMYAEADGRGLVLSRAAFDRAWKRMGYSLLFLEPAPPEQGEDPLARALEGAEKAPAEARHLADRLESGQAPADMESLMRDVGTNRLRRRVLADWLEERGHPAAADLYRQSADLFRTLDVAHPGAPPGNQPVASHVLRRIADLEEEALKLWETAQVRR